MLNENMNESCKFCLAHSVDIILFFMANILFEAQS